MDSVDMAIRDYLISERLKLGTGERAGSFPETQDFYRFIMDELEGEELERMLKHLSVHSEDQNLVAQARKLLETVDESAREAVPVPLMDKAKNLVQEKGASIRCPHCGKPITPFKNPKSVQRLWNTLWLSAAAVAFSFSFVFSRYFMQFLALTLFFGVKWAVDQKSTKTQILIYKALRDEEASSSHSRDLHGTSSRL